MLRQDGGRLAGTACTRARLGYGLGECLRADRIARGAQRFIEVIIAMTVPPGTWWQTQGTPICRPSSRRQTQAEEVRALATKVAADMVKPIKDA
jgi:hypothetical protein